MDKDIPFVLRALAFAAARHSLQRRKDEQGTPYINHPIGVALLLCECGVVDAEILAAALLHDTLEDTATTAEELRIEFGERVASIVQEVSDDRTLAKAERKRMQIAHAVHISTPAKLVKLADKLHNLSTSLHSPPHTWSVEQVQGNFLWSSLVCRQLRGVNEQLDARICAVYASKWHYQNRPEVLYAPLAEGDENELLERYLARL